MPRDYHHAKKDVFDAMPGTQNEIVARTGYDRSTVGRWVSVLRMEGQSRIGK